MNRKSSTDASWEVMCIRGLLFCHPSTVEVHFARDRTLGEADIAIYKQKMSQNFAAHYGAKLTMEADPYA